MSGQETGSNGSFWLFTSSETLLAIPVEQALRESEESDCLDYQKIFFARAEGSKIKGDDQAAIAWRLLGSLCQVDIRSDDVDEPFRPLFEMAEGRSLLPSDLDASTADAVRQLGTNTKDAELQARLLDITWGRLRDPEAARRAISSYWEAAEHLFDPAQWTGYFQRMERGLRLAKQLQDESLAGRLLSALEEKVIKLNGEDPLYLTARLMRLLLEFRTGDADLMSRIASKAAASAEEVHDFARARAHLKNLRRWRRVAGDTNGEVDAAVAVAESYEKQAELHSNAGGELQVSHFLQKAHDSYRNISGQRNKAEEVYGRLREAQQLARDALREIRTDGIDVSDAMKAAREHIAGRSLRDALLAFATVTRPTNFEKQTKSAREIIARFPLQSILGGALVGEDGRVVAQRTSLAGADGSKSEQALWEQVVQLATLSYQFKAQALIVPAINQLMFDHSPTLQDISEIVVNNPLVPPEHEELYAKAFLAGFRWKLPEALSILVPQLENSLRYVLAKSGAEVTKRDKQGIQNFIQMGTILSDRQAQLKPLFGDNIVKDLKVLFSDQYGPDLRNGIAHGLLNHDAFFSYAAVYACWLIFHLCISSVYPRLPEPGDQDF